MQVFLSVCIPHCAALPSSESGHESWSCLESTDPSSMHRSRNSWRRVTAGRQKDPTVKGHSSSVQRAASLIVLLSFLDCGWGCAKPCKALRMLVSHFASARPL